MFYHRYIQLANETTLDTQQQQVIKAGYFLKDCDFVTILALYNYKGIFFRPEPPAVGRSVGEL